MKNKNDPVSQKRNYSHLTQNDRDRIAILTKQGHSQKEIAEVIGKSPATISRELRRNGYVRKKKDYDHTYAHHKAYVRRYEASWKGRKIDTHPEIQKYIVEKLKAGWSPDVISGRMKTEEDFYVSKNVIYRWLYSDRGNKYCEYLCTQRYDKKKRKKKTERVMIPDRVDISERPEEVETRGVAGHWEGDTVVSGKNTKSTVAITVLSERKSRLARIRKITDLRPITFNEAVVSIQDTVRIETVTLDNGIENKYHKKLGIDTYFCKPYSSWEKGGVENLNGIIRRFVKKGSDIDDYTEEELQRIEDYLNHTPRKILGYKTPFEVAKEDGIVKT
jgi:IS30 family transposase